MQAPIRVRAKPGVLVPVPRLQGGIAQYIGRDIDHEACERAKTDPTVSLETQYPPSKDALEFSVLVHGVEVMSEIRRSLRDGDLLEERKAAAPPKTLAQEAAMPAAASKGKG